MTPMEFEGRTEREAVAKAAAELGSESFDVEVLEKGGGLFGRGKVRIRVSLGGAIPDPTASYDRSGRDKPARPPRGPRPERAPQAPRREFPKDVRGNDGMEPARPASEPEVPVDPPSQEILDGLKAFLEGVIERMGYAGTAEHGGGEGNKLNFEIHSKSSSILIGKKGKNLDALQLLANVYLGRLAGEDAPWRVVLDTEGYRKRREESLVSMALKSADDAVKSRSSRLLEPMNPFERRLIHTALGDRADVMTKSEGEGLYKRVRIIYKGAQRPRR